MTIKFKLWAGRGFQLTGTPDTFWHLLSVLQECEEWSNERGYEASAKWAREAHELIHKQLEETGYFEKNP